MERIVKHIRVYHFEGNAPSVRSEEDLVNEFFYDEKGRKIRTISPSETVEHFYETGNLLKREIADCSDDSRMVLTYFYDHDNNLIRCHTEVQCVYDGDGEYVFIPTGDYSDEWYDWSNEGRTCIRTKESHYRDGTVAKELTREEYNDLGWLRAVYHNDGDFHYESYEFQHRHYPDGALLHTLRRVIFVTKDGIRHEMRCKENYADERMIDEEYSGTSHEGNAFQNSFHFEYEDDEEGNWLIRRQMKNGEIKFTILREIEYW